MSDKPTPNSVRFEATIAVFSKADWDEAGQNPAQLAQNLVGHTGAVVEHAEEE